MLSSLYNFVQYVLRKVAVAAVVGSLALMTLATWLFLQDKTDFETTREAQLQQLTKQVAELQAEHEAVTGEVSHLRKELETEQTRVDRAAWVVTGLEPQRSHWERWFGDASQQDRIDDRLAKTREIEASARARVLVLQNAATQKDWELHGIQTRLAQAQAEFSSVEHARSWITHYLIAAWFKARWFLLAALIVYFIGTPLRRAAFYLFIAPLLAQGKPLRFGGQAWDVAEVAENPEKIDVALWPGERLRVRRDFSRSGDAGLATQRRLFLTRRFPLMCWMGHLTRLVELHHQQAREARVVTLAADPERALDFAMFNVPDGGSLMLRARYLAAVVLPPSQKLRVRSRWRLFDRHAWAAGQLRFLEFCGPCRLIVASRRSLRVSHVPSADAGKKTSRVAERRRVIGFSPSLEFGQVRHARFWRYVFSGRELLDGRFVGAGLMLSEEPPERLRRKPRPFVRGLWNDLIDAFGY